MAHIQIPFELVNGNVVTHNDRAKYEFSKCSILPPLQTAENASITKRVHDLLNEEEYISEDTPALFQFKTNIDSKVNSVPVGGEAAPNAIEHELFVQSHEILKTANPRLNTSFKNKLSRNMRKTMRNKGV